MVDRITPVTTDADRRFVREVFGVDDAWPVVTEPFTQWVMEDHFTMGRPEYERVGVQMVDDVASYELMKLRLLNASHQAMAYIGMLCGYTYVHEIMEDDLIPLFLQEYFREAIPTLSPVPGIDLRQYTQTLFARFRNDAIADTLARLAVDASDRVPKFVLPTVWDNLAAGRSIEMGAAVVASWARYLEIADADSVVDGIASELIPLASELGSHPEVFIEYRPIFGDLGRNSTFADAFANHVKILRNRTPREWLQQMVGSN